MEEKKWLSLLQVDNLLVCCSSRRGGGKELGGVKGGQGGHTLSNCVDATREGEIFTIVIVHLFDSRMEVKRVWG